MRYQFKLFSLLVAVGGILATGCQSSQRTFKTPEEAVTVLDNAVQKQDSTQLVKLFGPDAKQLRTGDPDQDRADAIVFARRLKQAHKIRMDAPDRAVILVGEEEWPFAVPLVLKNGAWRFDADAGLIELTNRRIGRNELLTIAACNTLIDAQAEFFARDPDGLGVKHYAQKLMSTEGKKDGLYWPAPGGVDPSPVGPVIANAATRRDEKGKRIPFHGYLYKLLDRQAASAPGGAMDFRQDGRLTRGWAVVAYPADYAVTGIMSFLCSEDGTVYEQDLGDDTTKAVAKIEAFDPGAGWKPVAAGTSTQP